MFKLYIKFGILKEMILTLLILDLHREKYLVVRIKGSFYGLVCHVKKKKCIW